jgi:hypothetical protein
MGSLGVINFANRLMTFIMDDAINKVYPAKITFDIENPDEWGPDAELVAQSKDARFEFVQPPNQAFSNMQLVRDTQAAARSAVMMPPSRSGDPNESIISAAGINMTQTQFNADVASIERDIIAPMLEAANELAFKADEVWCDADKQIYGYSDSGGGGKESYRPSKDIKGCYHNTVEYGAMAGMDPVNRNVMVLQQFGAGLLDEETAMEQSPFVPDPQRVRKKKVLDKLDEAQMAGLIAQAGQGTLDPGSLAAIRRSLEKDEVPLHDAIAQYAIQAPLAAPAGVAPGATPAAPGTPGAAEGSSMPQNMPNLSQLLGSGAGG